jgi:hypothetical protein
VRSDLHQICARAQKGPPFGRQACASLSIIPRLRRHHATLRHAGDSESHRRESGCGMRLLLTYTARLTPGTILISQRGRELRLCRITDSMRPRREGPACRAPPFGPWRASCSLDTFCAAASVDATRNLGRLRSSSLTCSRIFPRPGVRFRPTRPEFMWGTSDYTNHVRKPSRVHRDCHSR